MIVKSFFSFSLSISTIFFLLISNPSVSRAYIQESRAYPYYFYLRGVFEMLEGKNEQAQKSFMEARSTDPDSSAIVTELALLSARSGDAEKAVEWGETALALNPANNEAKILLARLYAFDKTAEESIELLDEVLTAQPDNQEAISLLASLLSQRGDHDRAIDMFRKLAELDSSKIFTYYYYIGKLYQKTSDYHNAIKNFNISLTHKPDFLPAQLEIARCYKLIGKVEKAVDAYTKLFDERAHPELRIELAEILVEENRFKDAQKEFHTLLINSGENGVKICLNFAIKQIKNESPAEALVALESILEIYPKNDQALFLVALAYEQQKNIEEAQKELKKIDPASPFGIDASIRLALLLEEQDRREEAISTVNESLERNPGNNDLMLTLASLYEKSSKEQSKALIILREAHKRHPQDLEIIIRIAMILDSEKKYTESVQFAEKALVIDPDYVPALNFLGYIYAEKGVKLDIAEELITRALSFKPDDGYIVDSMGWVYFKRKEYDLAVQYLEKAHELVPEDPVILSHLGDALAAEKRYEKALKAFRKSLLFIEENKKLQLEIKEKIKSVRKKLWDLVDN